MALTALQKQAAQAIVQIFETGSVRGAYGQVTLIEGDSGHLTYGKAQTTLASGNLFFLIRDYCAAPGAEYARKLEPFLPRLERRDTRLDHHQALKSHLRNAGADPVMHQVQDAFFDRIYWEPALKSAAYIGAKTALGTAIIYDSRIHGSWHARRDETIAEAGKLKKIGEQDWMRAYVEHRRQWLSHHPNPALHPTVYRMDELQRLIERGNWSLKLPFLVRGITISEETLGEAGPHTRRASAEEAAPRLLKLADERMVGEDVRELQSALKEAGYRLKADGIFGPATDRVVRKFQKEHDLVQDGMVGNLTREALGLASA